MIELPSGRKAQIIRRHHQDNGWSAVYVDILPEDDRVARAYKRWSIGDTGKPVWQLTAITFNWPEITLNDMADFQAVVNLIKQEALKLDTEYVPGQQVAQ